MKTDENAPGSWSQQGVTRPAGSEAGHDEPEVPLPADDETPVDEDMADVDANNAVSSEHPESGTNGRFDNPDTGPQDENDKEPRDMPASDPESGA
ncbi:hypothetical protein [Pseudomonas chlororaphis]|uniref:hypothetical protein n=1 Tax=Pseudomonas chlororaphis TaxID=587753 RepID=UPI000F584B6F